VTQSFIRFGARRIAGGLAFVLAVAASSFALTHLAPGDATTALKASGATADVIVAERSRLGLDQPFSTQFIRWARGLAVGNLGTSSQYRRPCRRARDRGGA
jgi:peptide/nickel transport system permease protein